MMRYVDNAQIEVMAPSPRRAGPAVTRPAEPPPALVVPLAPGGRGIRHYEELDGATGRGVFFRPRRFSAADLAPLVAEVIVTIAGVRWPCALVDLSQNGVAVAWPAGLPVQQGQRVAASIRLDEHVAFRGEATAGSIRRQGDLALVGLSLEDFMLDVEELLELRAVRQWASTRGLAEVPPAWRLEGGEAFKALTSELRLFLDDARDHLDALEPELPWGVLNGDDHPARQALIASLRSDFVAPVLRLTERIDEAVRLLPGGHANPAARGWSMRQLHAAFMTSPAALRCYQKPFGYPGDYEVMNFLYTRHFEGASLFARALTLTFVNAVSGHAVRCRKDLVKRELKALLARCAGAGRPVRVLSIAAGPAQELWELFGELEELPVPLEVVLFEQDENALAHAWRRLHTAVEARLPGQVKLTFLHDSIKRLLRDRRLFAPFGQFDLVYSCGLFDYLAQPSAVILARRLAASTRPGGRLLVANMVDHRARWLLEHHLDWTLVYRTHERLLEVGRCAVPGAQVRLLEEASGVNPFFELVAP
jgi:SAM-dependent methyltransferase